MPQLASLVRSFVHNTYRDANRPAPALADDAVAEAVRQAGDVADGRPVALFGIAPDPARNHVPGQARVTRPGPRRPI